MWVLFSRMGNLSEEVNVENTRKLPPRKNFHAYTMHNLKLDKAVVKI